MHCILHAKKNGGFASVFLSFGSIATFALKFGHEQVAQFPASRNRRNVGIFWYSQR